MGVWLLVYGFVVGLAMDVGAYILVQYGLLITVPYWFREYARRNQIEIGAAIDLPYLLGASWWLIVPIEACRKGGWRGVGTVAFLCGLIVVGGFAGAIVRFMADLV